ncbi:MAG TPA: glycosyltransferase family 2 protein, partial [Candidatus Xenobia bacterium]
MRTLVLLTWDERPGLEVLLPRLQQLRVDEMLCVDGGSQDGTRELLQDRGIRVLDQPRRGRGEAFRVGAAHARGDYLVYFSPDGNEDPNDIEKLFTALEGGADMAIASRFLPGARNEEDGQRWPLRKWVNLAFTWIANVLWNRGHWISDTINGFRGIRRQLFLSLDTRSMGYTIEY